MPPNRLIAGRMKLAMKHLHAGLLRPFVLSYLTATLGPDRGLGWAFASGLVAGRNAADTRAARQAV